jgi:YD repeat-containing protein
MYGSTYQYLDNANRPYLITMVTNKPSKGAWTWTTSRFTYDVKRRVTSAERTPSGERWQYSYDDAKSQVTVTEPTGWRVLYDIKRARDGLTTLDPVGGVETTAGKPSGLPPMASTQAIVVPPFIIPTCWFGFLCPSPEEAPAMCSNGYPPGYWPGDRGAQEWGRRYGVGAAEGKRRFHDLKGRTPGSRPNDNYGVNPGTGDVVDPNGDSVGNLEDQ